MKRLEDMSVDEINEAFAKLDEAMAIQDRLIRTYEEGLERMDAIELDRERRIA
jgi:hypothetical protein